MRAPETNIDLLPCPFCGGAPESEAENNGLGTFWIICDNDGCGCEGPYKGSADDAAVAWNSRTAVNSYSALQARVAELERENARLREALKPFATFADDNVEFVPFNPLTMSQSYCWNADAVKNDRIFEWFGPTDFGAASAALQGGSSNG
jgi:Lar family restriction alleviation protein